MIPRIPHPWPAGEYPYEALDGTGIHPQSTHDEVLNLSFELQMSDKMTPAVRQAWDRIRTTEARLVTDFFLYNAALSQPNKLVDQCWKELQDRAQGRT